MATDPASERRTSPRTTGQQSGATPDVELQRLGAVLYTWRNEVLNGMAHRSRKGKHRVDPAVERRLQRVGMVCTIAVARAMSGEGELLAHEDEQESWLIFGELAAKRALPLNEAIERCLHWREAAEETLLAITAILQTPQHVHARALTMLQRSLTATLIQMGEAFESAQRQSDQQRTRREEELAFTATHDPLTGLPNRALILDRLEQMLLHARHAGSAVAALFIDLDDFKEINDTHGHHTGDELLKAVAGRLTNAARELDTLGRLGGDEFVLLASDPQTHKDPPAIARRTLKSLSAPFALPDTATSVQVTASIGVHTSSDLSPGELLHHADMAMYQAKWSGKNRCFTFQHDSNAHRGEARAHTEPRTPRAWRKSMGRLTQLSIRRRAKPANGG